MKYRAEIDGLRAVAVTSVILFHSNIPGMRGGFVGVDVFFVISGYLITSIILKDLREQHFSLKDFYLRRAKRILPNLFAMVFFTICAGAMVLTPAGFARLMRSVVTVVFSVSNFSFSKSEGYFDEAAGWKPLLHTWSLGIEEQFYLFLPFFLMSCRSRLPRWTSLQTIAIPFLISLVISIIVVRISPGAAYYLPFGRFWELLVGSMLAASALTLRQRLTREAVGFADLLLVAFPMVFYSGTTLFPGERAAIPVIGAALIILSTKSLGEQTLIATILSVKPTVFIGKLSYSLYLWHWPVLFFARTFVGRELTVWESMASLPITALLSYFAWHLIENPARRSAINYRYATKLTATVVAACTAGLIMTELTDGLPGRFAVARQAMALGAGDINPKRRACDGPSVDRVLAGNVCVLGAGKAPPTVALMGDSIGDALAPGVIAAAGDAGENVMILTKAGCRPIIRLDPENSDECQNFLRNAVALIRRTSSIRSVIVVGRWANIASGYRFGATRLVDASGPVDEAYFAHLVDSLSREFAGFVGKRVFPVAFVPEQDIYVPQTLLARDVIGMPPPKGVSRAVFDERQKLTKRLFSQVRGKNVHVIDATPYFCDNDFCPVLIDGLAAYVDDNHPSSTMAIRSKQMFAPAFSE